MRELALFAGAGGGILGSVLLGWRTVCAVEIDPYCRRVLMQRQNDGVLDPFPIWDDVRTFDGAAWRNRVDVVSAGFPCQPFSVAGKRRGADDERNLWPETIRIIREVGPRFCLLENVPGLLVHEYFGTILGDMAESGFDARWRVLSAAELGAPHRRDRLWIVSNTPRADQQPGTGRRGIRQSDQDVAYPEQHGLEGTVHRRDGATPSQRVNSWRSASRGVGETGRRWWATEPDMGRVAHGVAFRVDRLKALGNGQVPIVAATAWRLLTGEMKCESESQ